jgi:hypothetical protein
MHLTIIEICWKRVQKTIFLISNRKKLRCSLRKSSFCAAERKDNLREIRVVEKKNAYSH